MFEKFGGLEGKNNKKTVKNKSENDLSNLFKTGERRRNLDSHRSSDILPTAPMGRSREAKQGIQPEIEPRKISPGMKLHQQLESARAYDRLNQFDARRAKMLQTYLTTEKSISEIAQEEGLSKTQAHQQIHASMDVAFFTLPEDQRAEYDNNPEVAFQTRSMQQTQTKSERLKEAHSNRPKNADTGKIVFSETHRQRLTEGNLRRWQREREAAQATRTSEQPEKEHQEQADHRKSSNTSKNEATGNIEFSETHRQRIRDANLQRWERERAARRAGNQKQIRRSPGR